MFSDDIHLRKRSAFIRNMTTRFLGMSVYVQETNPFTPVSIYNHSYPEENYVEQQ